MKRYLMPAILLVPMGMLFVLFQQCSGVNFKAASDSLQWQHDCAKDSTKCRVKIEKFDTAGANKRIDFTWIVDNSGSMSEEVQKTQDNIELFAQRLASYTDLKMALLSASPSNTYVPDGNPNFITMPSISGLQTVQEDRFVASSDALIILGLALCPANAPADSWCKIFSSTKKDMDGKSIYANRWNNLYGPTMSSLSNFMREQSHKVFVIVSDDDALRTSNPHRANKEDFINAYQTRFPNSSPVVYSIVGVRTKSESAADGCEIYGQGLEYIALSTQTNGKAFDICKNDWSSYYDEMLDGIETLAKYSFPLSTVNIVGINSVKINNVALNPGDYTYQNRMLTIKPELLSGGGVYNIEVELVEYVN